jgi:hypothetical protein
MVHSKRLGLLDNPGLVPLSQLTDGQFCPSTGLGDGVRPIMERSLGHARDFFLKRNKLETQLFVLRPHWGHALRGQGVDNSDTTDPDFMSRTK